MRAGGGGNNMYMQIDEESVIIKISVIILKEKSLNNFDYSPKGCAHYYPTVPTMRT